MGVPMNEDTMALPLPAQPPRRRLQNCCCGCSLQTGCIIIGTWTLINSIIMLYSSATSIIGATMTSFGNRDGMLVPWVLALIWGTIVLACSFCLLYGADRKRTQLMKFWLYARYVELILILCIAIYVLIMLTHVASYIQILVVLCVFALGIGIVIYTITVVQNFCSEVNEEMRSMKEELFVGKF